MYKLLASVAIFSFFAAAARGGEPGGTPDALFFSEAALGGTVGVAFFVAGYTVGGDPAENAGTAREKASYAISGAAPVASALTVYFVGENAGLPAANRRSLLLATTAVSYGAAAAAGAVGWALAKEDRGAAAVGAAFYSVIPAAFLNALVYNALKEPYFAEVPGYSLRVTPSFYVCRLGADGEELTPVWGITVSF